MLKGKTKSGFEYTIDENSLNDYRLVKDMAKLEDDPLKIVSVMERLLGSEQEEALCNHVADADGKVDITKITEEFTEIFNNQKEVKN